MSSHVKTTTSVVVPVWNGERYLAEALDSIFAQSVPPDEVIVVDDGSSDGTAAVARRFGERIRFVQQPHAGGPTALNRGLDEARGDVLAFLDADDIWMPDKQRQHLDVLARAPELDAVFGHVQQFYSPDADDALRSTVKCAPEPQPGHLMTTMTIRRGAFERVGRFDAGWWIGWFARSTRLPLATLMLPEVVLQRRIHADNFGRREKAAGQSMYLRELKAHLDRKRQGS